MRKFKVVGYEDVGRSFDTFEEARKFIHLRKKVAQFVAFYHNREFKDAASRQTQRFIQEEFKILSYGD